MLLGHRFVADGLTKTPRSHGSPRRVFHKPTVAFIMLAWIAGACVGSSVQGQGLPDESRLPGAQAVAGPNNEPPSEEVLPSTTPPTLPNAGDVAPGTATESDLPNQGAAVAIDRPMGFADESRPLLRLALDGHTGAIRTTSASSDGKILVSAGDDKELHVWSPQSARESSWFHRRTIRWPITRGSSGRIYRVAARGNEVALAGHTYLAGLGEIWIVDALSGDLLQVLNDQTRGHRQVVVTLAWAPDGSKRLVSADFEGKVMLWEANANTGLWSGRVIVDIDRVTYGEAIAAALKPRRPSVPVAWLGPSTLLVPRYTGVAKEPAGGAIWQLQKIDIASQPKTPSKPEFIPGVECIEYVVSLATTGDGKRLVVSDAMGATTLLQFNASNGESTSQRIATGSIPLAVSLSAAGSKLLVGTAAIPNATRELVSRLQLWDIAGESAKLLSQSTLSDHIRSCDLVEASEQAVASVGNRLAVFDIADGLQLGATPRGFLDVPAKPIRQVQFTAEEDRHVLAIGTELGPDGTVLVRDQFDLDEVQLRQTAKPDETYLKSQRLSNTWSVRPITTPEGSRFQLYENDQPRGVLPFQVETHGAPTSIATLSMRDPLTDADGDVVIVGTGGRNNIYVYAADDSNPPRLLRQYRAHQGEVLSLATSADGKYLASGSSDATIGIWKLEEVLSAGELSNRWGVRFELDSERLLASEVRDDGPLHFRGVRGGDVLINIRWADAVGNAFSESDPTRMLERLRTLPFDTLVVFEFTRLGRPVPGFQSFAAWQPIATLFLDETREWAFWTPAGYYNASINGHTRFGWQINRGIDRLPDYYRAAQFREMLERPAVMKRLLSAGSLEKAMRSSLSGIGPPPGESAIANQVLNQPRIEIVKPRADEVLRDSQAEIVARITVPGGGSLALPKAFASGVPAVDRELVADEVTEKGRVLTFRWLAKLPSESTIKLEVIAATEAAAVERVSLDLPQSLEHVSGKPRPRPRLHVIAIGVSQYRDRQIQPLDFASRATGVIAELFQSQSTSLYRVTSDQLIDADATRPMWRLFASEAAETLRATVLPDDLVVIYMCGHGLRDRRTGQWYFVTSDARYSDLMNDEYGDCLSLDDFAALASLPCRKLAILDSCHSGAVQPLMQTDDLKSAIRFLQDDIVITLTASEGGEEAAEQRESQLGRFSAQLVAALQGDADRSGDGVVTLRETIAFVTERVAEVSKQEGDPQHPTASPEYLLESIDFPLAKSGASSSTAKPLPSSIRQ